MLPINRDTPASITGAVVLAAGESRRMGVPKLSLPWGDSTIIGRIVKVLLEAGLIHINVITGGGRETVEKALHGLPVQTIFNPHYADNAMLHSLQIGLAAFTSNILAALVVLGDQPQIELETVRLLLDTYQKTGHPLIVPSFQNHRGHPWLVGKAFWPEILALRTPATLRDFLNSVGEQIHYINVTAPSILKDLDTPADYAREQPQDHDHSQKD